MLRREVEIPASCERSSAPLWLAILVMSAIAGVATIGWATTYIDKQRAELDALAGDITRMEREMSVVRVAEAALDFEIAMYVHACSCSLVLDIAPPDLTDR